MRHRGLGENLCRASLLSKGKPPLTAKSLSANLVYHSFAFPSPYAPSTQGKHIRIFRQIRGPGLKPLSLRA
jgi:hypothetical protein